MNFDYIIAGGGSAGCALASRLAEDPTVSVCLIESGGKGNNLFIRMPAGNGFVFGNPKLDWGYTSIPQVNLNNRKIYFPRGKGLGGSSIVNGMVYMRGVPIDYDRWRQMGLPGWSFSELLPYFKRAEGSSHRDNSYHGKHGPLKTETAHNYGEFDEAFIKASMKIGHKYLDDFNGPERTGVSRVDSTVFKGIRQSSAISYLRSPVKNLKIFTENFISHILFNNYKAIGIKTIEGKEFYCNREVIVCQGAFGTPHLLMHSGIGPADHLKKHGIKPLIDLPGVGSNLADHVDVSMQYLSNRMDLSLARFQRLDKSIYLMAKWLLSGSGPGSGSFFSTVLFHAFDDPKLPELEVYMTPMIIEENFENGAIQKSPFFHRLGQKLLVRGRKVARPGIQIDINQERPRSLGTVRLSNPNPKEYPLIDPNYLSDPEDLEELIKGVAVVRDIMSQNEISKYITHENEIWSKAKTRDEIINSIRETAYTGHHPCSTAKMGADNDHMAVLDSKLKVRGIEGLRVCDASAMPTQITGNLYATVIAMAEKAADLILDRPPLSPEFPDKY